MLASRTFAGKTVGVFGLARSGLAALRALRAGGAEVYAWDDKDTSRNAAEGATMAPWQDWPWEKVAALVLSPGVPLTHPEPHPVVRRAKEVGAEVIGDIELFAREILGRAPIIAVTGTNGKSTITALVGHILSACGFDAQIGGNIGKSALDLSQPQAKTIYVLEMSSYQIDLSPGLKPDVSVLSNITPDHIDRHGTMENYAAVKAQLLMQTMQSGLNVIGVDDSYTSAVFTKLSAGGKASCVAVSVGKVLGRGIFVLDGTLYDAQNAHAVKVMELGAAEHLPGAHNWQNAALAYGVVRRFVKDARAVASAIAEFPGLAHRIEAVARLGKVRFVNDSKATNAEAAARALACYSDIFWIAGGKAKEGGIAALEPLFPRIRKAYLIGAAATFFASTLEGKVEYAICGTLENAIAVAAGDAAVSQAPAPVVLLSPAAASFDQFRDFEQRGDVFRDLANKIAAPEREAS